MENIREANVGYLKCTVNNEKENSAYDLRLTVNLFRGIQKHRNTLSRDNVRIFQTPILLSIANTKSSKAKLNVVGRLSKNKLEEKIK